MKYNYEKISTCTEKSERKLVALSNNIIYYNIVINIDILLR